MTSPTPVVRPGADKAAERIAASLVAVYALGAVTALFLLLLRRGHRESGPFELMFSLLGIPSARSLVSLVILVLLTGALIRRKRIAWVVALAFEVASAVWSLLVVLRSAPGRLSSFATHASPRLSDVLFEAVGVAVSVLMIVLLWRARYAFPSRLSRGSWPLSLSAGAAGWVVTLLVTRLCVRSVMHAGFAEDTRMTRLALLWSLGLDDLGALPRRLQWVPQLTGLLLSVTIAAAVLLFLRSGRGAVGWTPGGEMAVRELVTRYGAQDTLSYFATRRDRSAIFSPDGRACVSYAVFGAVSLAAGDPLGPPEAWPGAIAAWRRDARRNGWLPAVISASEAAAAAYVSEGMSVMVLGDEAILHTDRFQLETPQLTDVRHAAAHARRAGVTVTVARQRDVPPEQLTSLIDAAQQWRHGVERGFSMTSSRYGDPADGGDTLVIAWRDGRPVALLTFVPWGKRGLSLDVMRRASEAPSGVTELMVSELMRASERLGIQQVSLNFAVMRGVFADADRLGAPLGRRAGAQVLGFMDRFFQLERLYRSNEKYRPDWIPRYICFDGPAALPRTVVAFGRAEGYIGHRRMTLAQLPPADARKATELAFRPIHVDEREIRRSEQTRVRIQHRGRLAASGRLGCPGPVERLSSITPGHDTDATITGRIAGLRHHGGVIFIDLTDRGVRRQVVLERGVVPDWGLLSGTVDLGDLFGVHARWGVSRTGTESLLADDWTVVAKSLHAIPFHGFSDAEARARNRSLDLLVHPAEMTVLEQRSLVVAAMRHELVEAGFSEVETPILGTTHGGATARPFKTWINAYNASLYLRIAPELALKRLLAAGSGPIFEMARNFRNEGADASHNPEFTALEAYQPYGDYETMRILTERLIRACAVAVHGAPRLPLLDESARLVLTDVSAPWPVVDVCDAVSAAVGERVDLQMGIDHLLEIAARHDVAIAPESGPGAVIEELYGEIVEPATIRPTFYRDFPVETSPLAGAHPTKPGFASRWDLVVNGMEIGTAYSELVDPLEQRQRLTAQSLKAAAGDAEAMEIDEDFLAALELGLPPTGGLGLGVDRVAMLVTGTPIRDVLTFPFVRPKRP